MRWPLVVIALAACSDSPPPTTKLEPIRRVGEVTQFAQIVADMPVWGANVRMRGTHTLGRIVSPNLPRSTRIGFDRDEAIRRAVGKADQALARTVWYPSGDALIAAWVVDAYTPDGNATRTILAGDDGRVLERYSLTADAFDYRVYAETSGELHPLDGPQQDATPHPTGVPDHSYPSYLASAPLIRVDSLNGDPWLPANATETVGNNVDAYVDFNAPNGLTTGDFRATTSSPGRFDYAYDLDLGPMTTMQQQQASIVSLFYVINWLHDFWYAAGFTEVAGNAQKSNYGRGGVENDPILAEAQDNALAGSRNNANMSTPDDGMSPRMQVYLWSGKDDRAMTIANRTPDFGTASFGPQDFDVNGSVVVGVDSTGVNTTDGCEALANNVTGKLVLVDRGNCTFRRKTLNVQNAGGIGVIIVNNVVNPTPPPLGDDSSLTGTPINIPSISLTADEGAVVKTAIGAGPVTATIHRAQGTELDGTLDSTLIAHEYGHYLHHRLTLCGNTMCRAMSEGWGDFTALMLIARAGDNLMGAYPFSVYATQGISDDPGYYGIRRAPYSADHSINDLSFRHMADGEPLPTAHPILTGGNNAEVHNAGEVWAAALWECYVALQQAGTDFNAVRAKMAKYVVEGLAMTPTEATPMEARDAILAVADPVDHDILLAAFARRGFGSCAVAPSRDSSDFKGLRESNVIAGNVEVVHATVEDGCDEDGIIDTGETAHVKVQVANHGHAPLSDVVATVTSTVPGLTVVTPPQTIGDLAVGASTDLDIEVTLEPGHKEAISAELALAVSSTGGCEATTTFPIATRFNVDDVPQSSATDTFDAEQSPWVAWSSAWHHVFDESLDGSWHGDALAATSDVRLSSPVMHASKTKPVTLTFSHRFAFEMSSGTAFDGGVIEYAVGNDDVWLDLSTLAAVPYNVTLGTDTGNVLNGRPAFSSQNAAYPSKDDVTINLGTALAGQAFRLRFRIGTDGGVGTAGWDIDNVALTGLDDTPFPTRAADDGNCEPPAPDEDPIISGGGGCCDSRGHTNGLLPLSVLALMLRRRRRR